MLFDLLTNASGQKLGNIGPLWRSFALLDSIDDYRILFFGPFPLYKARLECLRQKCHDNQRSVSLRFYKYCLLATTLHTNLLPTILTLYFRPCSVEYMLGDSFEVVLTVGLDRPS